MTDTLMPDVRDVPAPSDAATATEALRWFETHIGGGFHPDTRGADYAEWPAADADRERQRTGPVNLFTPEQAVHYDTVIAAVFEHLDDPYAVSMDLMTEIRRAAGENV